MNSKPIVPLQELIPDNVWKKIKNKKVVEAGWGAGPLGAAVVINKFDPPCDFAEAFEWLEVKRTIFRKCHLIMHDESIIYIDRYSFSKYETKSQRK